MNLLQKTEEITQKEFLDQNPDVRALPKDMQKYRYDEYEKFRIKQDKEYISDFDIFMNEIDKLMIKIQIH